MKPRHHLFVLALGLFVSIALAQTASAQHFRAAGNYSVAHNPIAIAAGDFTGSGSVDLAVRHVDGSVSVLHGFGNGAFAQAIHYQQSAAPAAAVAALNTSRPAYLTGKQLVSSVSADFNRDGVADQAVSASGSGRVSVLLGSRTAPEAGPNGNILQNPGFESGVLTPWFIANNFCSSPCKPWTVGTIHPRTGTYDGGDIGNIEVEQDFTGVSTSTITKVVLWVRHPTGTFLPAAVDFIYTDGTDQEFVVDTTDQYWDSFDLTSDILSGSTLSGIGVYGFSGGGVTPTTFIDNVSILTQ